MKSLLSKFKVVILFVFMLTFSSFIYSQDADTSEAEEEGTEWGIDLALNFNTTYYWRGLDFHAPTYDFRDKKQEVFNFAPSINPEFGFWVAHSVGAFYGGLWFHIALTDRRGDIELQTLDEVDLYAGTELDTVKGGVFDFGITYYRYINIHDPAFDPEVEPYIGWKYFVTDEHHSVSGFTIIPSLYYYIDEHATSYIKIALDFEWEAHERFSFNPGLELGYWVRNQVVKNRLEADPIIFDDLLDNLLHLDIKLPFSVSIWNGISFDFGTTLSLRFYEGRLKSYAINGDTSAFTNRELLLVNVYWGISYSY